MKPRLLLPRSSTPQEEHAQHRARPGPTGGTGLASPSLLKLDLGLNFTTAGPARKPFFSPATPESDNGDGRSVACQIECVCECTLTS